MQYLNSILKFERKFTELQAKSLEDVSNWISARHAGYHPTPLAAPANNCLARFARAEVDEVSFVTYRWNVAVDGQFMEDYQAYFIGVPLAGQLTMLDSELGEITPAPNQLRIYRRAAGHRNIVSSGYANLSLIVPIELLEQRARSFFHKEPNEPLTFDPLLDMDTVRGQTVLSLITHVMMQLVDLPGAFDNPLVKTGIKEYLVSTLLQNLPHNYDRLEAVSPNVAIPRTVKQAEEYMRSFSAEPITIQDLANHAGCSERALHSAFRQFRGATPMAVLRGFRLQGAHDDIVSGMGSISEIAYRWGFCNPGRFAKLYAEKFGQVPSQTLRTGPLLPRATSASARFSDFSA